MAKVAQKNVGTKWYIGTQAATASSDTYTLISRTTSISAVGGQSTVLDATALEDATKQKLKGGVVDAGQVTLRGRRVYDDAGQNALKAAQSDADDEPFNFRLRIPSARTGAGTPDHQYTVKGLVTSFKDNIGGVDGLVEYEATIELTDVIVEAAVAAA